jgi:ATP-binding protein involved in chromosome partitioning
VTGGPVPERIHRGDDEIVVTWDGSHVSRFPAREMRLACHCATCRDEFTSNVLLDPDSVPQEVRALQVSLVGNYAIKIKWSDGHETGIYTYQYLLSLCSCERCARRSRG